MKAVERAAWSHRALGLGLGLAGLLAGGLLLRSRLPDRAAQPVSAAAAGASRAPAATVVPVAPLALALTPLPVQQGGQLKVSGRGFAAGEQVRVRASEKEAGPALLDLGQVAASSSGTVDGVELALPDALASGSHTIEAAGLSSGRRSSGVLWVRAREPWIVLDAQEVKAFTELGLIAGGFESDEQVLTSLEPRAQPAGTAAGQPPKTASGAPAAAPAEGAAAAADPSDAAVALVTLPADRAGNTQWSQVKLPRVKPGAYTLTLRGQSSGLRISRDVDIKPVTPVVELSPWAGVPGSPIELNAQGFAPGEEVRIYVGENAQAAAKPVADKSGNVWGAGPVRAPYELSAETLLVTLVGEDSGAHVTLQYKLIKPKPWLELSAWWGPPGTPVVFSGGGWAGGERISLHLGNAKQPAVGFGQADDYGWLRFAGPVPVPADGEEVGFVAVGEQSGAEAVAKFKVNYPFGLKPQSSPAAPRTQPPAPRS